MKILPGNKAIEPLFVVISTAVITAALIVYPEPKVLKVCLAMLGIIIGLYAPQSYLFWGTLVLILVPKSAGPFMNTSDIAIMGMASIMFMRRITEQNCLISMSNIVANSFFKISILILAVYIISLLFAFTTGRPGTDKHISFVVAIGTALLMANMVIGYIQDRARLRKIQNYLLIILSINLAGGLLTFFFPDVTFFFSGETHGTLMVGSGSDRALRLGGVFFFWEAYAEYLMMFLVFLVGWFVGGGLKGGRWQSFLLFLLLLTGVELLLTNTRGAIAIALLGVVLTVFMFPKKNILGKINLLCVISLMMVTLLILAQFSGKFSLYDRVEDFGVIESTKYGPMPKDRTGVWLDGVGHVVEHQGMGTGPSLYPETYYSGGFGHISWPHNLVLLILCTIGFQGLLAYCYMLFRMVKLKKYINRLSTADVRLFYNLGLLVFALFLLDTMKFDGWLRSPTNYFYFIWLLIAVLFSVETLVDDA